MKCEAIFRAITQSIVVSTIPTRGFRRRGSRAVCRPEPLPSAAFMSRENNCRNASKRDQNREVRGSEAVKEVNWGSLLKSETFK